MPECLVLGEKGRALQWQLHLENLGEGWRCSTVQDADRARVMLATGRWDAAVLCEGAQGRELTQMLASRPPLSPPWLLTEAPCAWADGRADLAQVRECGENLARWEREGRIPRLAVTRYLQMLCLARGLMRTLNVPRRLKAWAFLPDMLALCAVHPALGEDLQGRLYPLIARRHGLAVSTVERRLRLAIESTWSGASLGALERFFGHSVDPERGKPTNKEFIFRVQEHLLLSGRRIA